MHRLITISLALGLMAGAANAQSLVQEKLDMERAGFEKDSVVQKITYRDAARLDAYERMRGEAFKQARAGGAAEDIALLDEIDGRQKRSFQGLDLSGAWQCRTIKTGGLAPLIVYGWFGCEVSDDGSGWFFEKLTGSQLTDGHFFDDGDSRMIYLGVFSVSGDQPPAYGAGRETDQVGYVFRDGEAQWRIEFPAPERESILDIMEIRRAQ
ncbi:DUF4893 domain-containing protein [Nitratireductor aquimarinus]|uniref:DUF4893 domain-containing protein n=1 Tax=Nitratireductor aquimarinus TaxID=889300 RepID=UPI002935DB62|nr:DUF4893 domain-containing protein [Nitratireductor aquimarinus]MDV2964695.1 DUF4893 domain-containing protein [Nitratireductor aquimarinus]